MSERQRISALGKAITIRRVELGLSRNELRDRSGLSYPYVAELEKGMKSPSSRSLEAIAEALEIRPHELLARAEELMLAETRSMVGPDEVSAPLASGPRGAPRSAPSPAARRWFGPAGTSPPAVASGLPSPPPRARRRLAATGAASSPEQPLTEERVREIVREEIRRALGESLK